MLTQKEDNLRMKKGISIIIPVYNEESSITEVYEKTTTVMANYKYNYEIVFIDDGSKDDSFKLLELLSINDKKVKLIKLSRNYGQTPAIMAGIKHAESSIIVTLDGDMQNDPEDIPCLINKLEEGYDLVSGWRRNRQDQLVHRKIPSWIANKMISWFSGVKLHDFGCTLKAYRAERLKSIKLYGEMHRYIPVLIAKEGGIITEQEVLHHPRKKGESKYGMERVLKVLLDLILLKFLFSYASRPMHFFGYFGFASTGIGVFVGLLTLYQRYIVGIIGANMIPLVLLTMLFLLIGIQMIFVGVLAEIGTRTFFEFKENKTYSIERTVNIYE